MPAPPATLPIADRTEHNEAASRRHPINHGAGGRRVYAPGVDIYPHRTKTSRPASAWAPLEVACQRALLTHFACSPLAVSAPADSPVRWVHTGVASNIHNGVAAARLTGDTADQAITDTLRSLAGHPSIWHLDDTDTPVDLPDRLIRAGCRPERTAIVMGAPLAALPPPRLPAGVHITEITTADQIPSWRHVAAAIWHESTEVELGVEADLYASLPLAPTAPWRHWLAHTDTDTDPQPVGMVSGLFTQQTVMIEHLGVVPDRRGAGIGAALVSTVTRDAAANSREFAVLGPTPETTPFYARLGFTLQHGAPNRQFYLP